MLFFCEDEHLTSLYIQERIESSGIVAANMIATMTTMTHPLEQVLDSSF